MYDFIEGQIEKLTPAFAVLNCNGLGFHINISVYTFEKLIIDLSIIVPNIHDHKNEYFEK